MEVSVKSERTEGGGETNLVESAETTTGVRLGDSSPQGVLSVRTRAAISIHEIRTRANAHLVAA